MKDRIIEMFERGERVELVCADRDGLVRSGSRLEKANREIAEHDYIVVTGIRLSGRIEASDPDLSDVYVLMDSDLDYFIIKGHKHNPEYIHI